MDSGGSAGAGGTVIGDVVVADDSPFLALAEAVDGVLESGLSPASGNDAAGVLKAIDREQRRLHAAYVEVMDQIDQRSLYRTDGHANVRVQARHVSKLSGGEAFARNQTMKMFRGLPLIKAALWAGTIGIEQVQLLARVYANPRVQGAMELRQETFLHQASTMHYGVFETRVREWERLNDEDGAEPRGQITHENRNAKMSQSPIDMDWEFTARFGPTQGMRIDDILGHYVQAEWQADKPPRPAPETEP